MPEVSGTFENITKDTLSSCQTGSLETLTKQEKLMPPTKVPDQITKKEKAIESQAIHHATIAAGQYIEENNLTTVPMHKFNGEQFEGLIQTIGRAYTKEAASYFWLFVNMNENKTKDGG